MGKRGPKTPEGRERALANLRRGRPKPGEPHGVRSIKAEDSETAALAFEVQGLLADELGPAYKPDIDAPLTVALAQVMRQLDRAHASLLTGGLLKGDGDPRALVELWIKLLGKLESLTDRLGMSPQARSRLGMNLGAPPDVVKRIAEMYGEEGDANEETPGGDTAGDRGGTGG